jgi:VIT1/CCC1 family predicted Fe2+/Mn2+ transporter
MNAGAKWLQEMESVFLYRVIAAAETSPAHRALFEKLAGEAEKQAGVWAEEARRAGEPAPGAFVPSARARVVAALVTRLGPSRMRGVLAAMKVRGMSVYTGARAGAQRGHAMPLSVEDVGRRHRGVGGGNLRAAVFGANDGLVSNASLILGVAGAAGSGGTSGGGRMVLVSGVAGLLAGAFSMAAGEYVSVRSQREMFESQIGAERDELRQYPAEEAAELSLIYQARGLSKEDADRMASQIVANPDYALDALAREELGLDPGSLGSPLGAALFSLLSFGAGALVPLVPFLFSSGRPALLGAVALTAVALTGVGAAISLFTGREAIRGGLRMLLLGGAAATATFLIGKLLGVAAS